MPLPLYSPPAVLPPASVPQGIAPDFRRFGYWFQDNAGTRGQQAGVFRTNCIDCLDRTNVVQVRDGERPGMGLGGAGSGVGQARFPTPLSNLAAWSGS